MHAESSTAAAATPLLGSTGHPLDHPIWNALATEHRPFALGGRSASRYIPAVGPLADVISFRAECFSELLSLTPSGDVVALFLEEPLLDPPAGWSLIRDGSLDQMIFVSYSPACAQPSTAPPFSTRTLTPDDVPAMLELAALTEPGPFQKRTHELGLFVGAFRDNRLVAMAGQRTHLPGYVEVSAVCTHPSARGFGLARHLMAQIMDNILACGKTPFLHCFSNNHPAIRVYRDLGFELRRIFHLAVLQRQS